MALPASYTEITIGQYMHTLLGGVATVLGWTEPNSGSLEQYSEPINDTLIMVGVDDIADATDIEKLRAAARLAVWDKVVDETATYYPFATDQQRFDRDVIHQQALGRLKEARIQAFKHGINYEVGVTPITYRHDPYNAAIPDDERTLP